MKILEAPLHPFLLAVYFPLWLLSNNVGLFDIDDAYRSVAWNLAITGAVFATLRAVYGDRDRAGSLTSTLIALCFCYSAVTDGLLPAGSGGVTLVLIGVVWSALAVLSLRLRAAGSSISLVLNAVVAVMLIGPAYQVLRAQSLTGPIETGSDTVLLSELATAPGPETGPAPSIYHIVLDGYSRQDVLRELYGFDNAAFLQALRRMGFAVAEGATTPYGQTLLAMSSIFSMNYLDDYVEVLRSASPKLSRGVFRRRLSRHFWNSPVRRALAARGYRFVAIDTEYSPLRVGNADRMRVSPNLAGLSYFERQHYGMTPFNAIYRRLRGGGVRLTREAMRAVYALGSHDHGDVEPPLLVYNHVVSPHPPFSLDREGRPRHQRPGGLEDGNHWLADDAEREARYREGYLEKLRYSNAALLVHVQGLIDDSPDPKVIIVHGDHGGGLFLDHTDSAASCLKERFATLLAVYSSGGGIAAALGDAVNLVNLYRILFNAELGSALPALPDRSYFVTWEAPWDFERVDPDRLADYDDNCGGSRDR